MNLKYKIKYSILKGGDIIQNAINEYAELYNKNRIYAELIKNNRLNENELIEILTNEKYNLHIDDWVLARAAEKFMKKLVQQLIIYMDNHNIERGDGMYTFVIKSDNVEMYDWILNNYGENNRFKLYRVASAALNGSINILKFFIEKGYEISRNTCDHAIQSGNIEVLSYLKDKGKLECDSEAEDTANEIGNKEVNSWLRNNNIIS